MENTTLTRYQLLRAFIHAVTLAFIAVWYLNMGQSLFFVATQIGVEIGGNVFRAMLLSPLLLLLTWPLHGVLTRAILGARADEPVTSVRDLKSLVWPALGAILFVQALAGIWYKLVGASEMINAATQNFYPKQNPLALMLRSTEYSLLDWAFNVGRDFILDSFFLVGGLLAIIIYYLRSRRSAEPQFHTAPAVSLTRFQLARAHIYLTVLSLMVYWFLSTFLLLFQYFSQAGRGVRILSPLYTLLPLDVLLLLPFAPLLAHAMSGQKSDEIVDAPQKLRALIFPCIGFTVLVWSLSGIHNELWGAYNQFRRSSTSPTPLWGLGWQTLGWPVFKLSLGLLWVIFPSIREMVREVKSRVLPVN